MSENQEDEELRNLKREVAKLKLEANLRKSLADQLAAQKKIADEAKVEVEKKSKEVEAISTKLSKYLSPQIHEQNTCDVNNVREHQYQSFSYQKLTFQTQHDQVLDSSLRVLK